MLIAMDVSLGASGWSNEVSSLFAPRVISQSTFLFSKARLLKSTFCITRGCRSWVHWKTYSAKSQHMLPRRKNAEDWTFNSIWAPPSVWIISAWYRSLRWKSHLKWKLHRSLALSHTPKVTCAYLIWLMLWDFLLIDLDVAEVRL